MRIPTSPVDAAFTDLLLGSYRRLVGRPLVDVEAGEQAGALWLYEAAPFCLLAHDTSADPLFIYANRTAQACFGYTFEEIVTIPSRLSAETQVRARRQHLLDAVARDGFVASYGGVRIAKSGRRFHIDDATIWELVDETGVRHGQAAIIRTWRDVEVGA